MMVSYTGPTPAAGQFFPYFRLIHLLRMRKMNVSDLSHGNTHSAGTPFLACKYCSLRSNTVLE